MYVGQLNGPRSLYHPPFRKPTLLERFKNWLLKLKEERKMKKQVAADQVVLEMAKTDQEIERQFEERVLQVLAKRMEKSPHRTRDNHHLFTMTPSEVYQTLNPQPKESLPDGTSEENLSKALEAARKEYQTKNGENFNG